MFRRLFISLLILSTLTSDGTVNIAGYLIDLYRYDGLEPDLVVLDGNLFKEAVCENAEDSELLSADAYCIICAEKSKDDDKRSCGFKLFNNKYNYNAFLYKFPVQWIGENGSLFYASRDISLYMSDLSPPCI
ncbi:MAG TPA: hypothetical protein DEF39_02235 [Hungateiclostridium thermocellum]|jgi:hypothetical protein|uniref:Uncharacterized protein n=2 Tax=Acetivibrio thermocellus TaxID=1515 RepID=A3DF90_ACET2|nr:hypothetical protein [Acetivibrio thermocellus]CDG36063.1 hypothetical protein CTHBC1_1422 [Acetivibrio thermocellus BC1]ABN52619.1 hypothetical protein Cthe_1387 [Acetivibrio thermocellus ATCC 27405]ADU73929.1 hypothetical protein Clo1313_0861 [Acetivibrio thermocellus DSM 1313]ALX07867.1 hypothetical protein AD2_00872 [Acetivibrio thermocellus AD2]ANV75613.1 hypothetical protein LQRI_0872 [Acetivibrio thermocellus DSM 2360]